MKGYGKGIFFILFLLMIGLAYGFYPSQKGTNPVVQGYYRQLKIELAAGSYDTTKIMMISGKRSKEVNDVLVKMGTATENSQHLKGNAIDVLVFDINNDGKADGDDVDIVYKLLDEKIVKDKGGVGTYKNKKGLYADKMVHFDCRGTKARWHF